MEGIFRTRAKDLEKGLRTILNDPTGKTFTKDLFEHPLIAALFVGDYKPGALGDKKPDEMKDERERNIAERKSMPLGNRRNLPSYIPGASFAGALIDVLVRGTVKSGPGGGAVEASSGSTSGDTGSGASESASGSASASGSSGTGATTGAAATADDLTKSLMDAVSKIEGNDRLKRAVELAIDYAHGDIEAVKANLGTWFDSAMDRVSGWYKRRTQLLLFFVGLFDAVVLNVDTLTTATHLMNDDTLRDSLVALAEKSLSSRDATDLGGEDTVNTQNELDAQPESGGQATGVENGKAANVDAESGGKPLTPAETPPAGEPDSPPTGLTLDQIKVELGSLGFPMGWEDWRPGPQFAVCYKVTEKKTGGTKVKRSCSTEEAGFIWARIIIGWLITALAVMLGAPFWFDLLAKFMSIRATGKPINDDQKTNQGKSAKTSGKGGGGKKGG